MTNYLEFKNFSTILNTIIVIICGYLIGLLASFGLALPVTASELAAIVTAIVFGIFGYYNAKHQNDIFDEETDTVYIPVDDLSKNQIDAINNFIENCLSKNKENMGDMSETDDYEID